MTGVTQAVFMNQRSFITVPGAPTIGTATKTGSTTATVSFTAPASNGGATITLYTAIDQNSTTRGTLAQAGSGTINLTGLTSNTNYTFRVFATNSVGNSANSAASNQITTDPPTGQQAYTTAGTYSWVAPAGVTSVSVVAVGAGSVPRDWGCEGRAGGGGGALAYINNYSVTPTNSYNVIVGGCNYGNGGDSTFISTAVLSAGGGKISYTPYLGGIGGLVVAGTGYSGGKGGFVGGAQSVQSGAGGAGGYSGAGGDGAPLGSNGARVLAARAVVALLILLAHTQLGMAEVVAGLVF